MGIKSVILAQYLLDKWLMGIYKDVRRPCSTRHAPLPIMHGVVWAHLDFCVCPCVAGRLMSQSASVSVSVCACLL